MRRWRTRGWSVLVLGVLGACGLAEPTEKGYSPVSPPSAVGAALLLELKVLQGWIDDKDFASAVQCSQGLTSLAHLHGYQGSQPAWRAKSSDLAATCTRLASSARNKDAGECSRLVKECRRLLDELAKTPPGSPASGKDFKPQGSTATWMRLMDGVYSDAKTARTPEELERLAGALAEEVNAYQYARADARWQQLCQEVRSSALAAVEKAKAKDLAAAKVALKGAYRSCEACHERSRK
jgi:hypothetical protein